MHKYSTNISEVLAVLREMHLFIFHHWLNSFFIRHIDRLFYITHHLKQTNDFNSCSDSREYQPWKVFNSLGGSLVFWPRCETALLCDPQCSQEPWSLLSLAVQHTISTRRVSHIVYEVRGDGHLLWRGSFLWRTYFLCNTQFVQMKLLIVTLTVVLIFFNRCQK